MTRYEMIDERILLGEVEPTKRVRARSMCATTRAEYRWLLVDVCAERRGAVKRLPPVTTTRDAARVCREFINQSALVQEVFGVLCLDSRLQPVGFAIPHRGGLDSSIVDVKTVFKPALLIPASAIVVCHNHPSGDARPSDADREMTTQLDTASRYLGIRFLDHLVLGEGDDYFSFSEAGIIRAPSV